MAADGTDIIKRFIKLKSDAYGHFDRWERMAPYLAPSRVGIVSKRPDGDKQTRGVYDSTMMMAAELMAMFIAGHIINPSQRWFGYEVKNQTDSIKEWLEECRDISLTNLGASLFYAEGPESLIDYGGFGTGFLLGEEAPQPINHTVRGFRGFTFTAEKTGRFIIQEGADGRVDTGFREFELSARVASDRWGINKLSEKLQAKIKEGKGDEQFKFIHAIYPRSVSEQRNGAGNTAMPWASCWIEFDTKQIAHESGYRVFPAAVPRYHKTPGEVFGRGRGDIAFPDTWSLNTAKRMGFEDWALKIRPPILHHHDSVIGTLKLVPGGPTSVNTHGRPMRDVVAPFETGSRPEVSQIKEEELRKSIRSIFYVDQILALLEVNKSEMTAFEFARKIELLFRLLGPVYGRLEWEYLHQTVDIIFDVQFNAGAFPPPPPEIYQTDGKIDVVFQNPIAKAQRAGDAEALTLAMNDIAPLVQLFGPEIADRLDPTESVDGILDLRGVPARWQRNDKQIFQLRAARAKRQEQELALQNAEQIATAAGKAAPALVALQGRAAAAGAPTAPR
jgi:hypothetical protein